MKHEGVALPKGKDRSRYKGRMVDALALEGEEGRGQRRNATGSCKRAWIRGYPNGETRYLRTGIIPT